ncbi:oligosaccharide flippase family protein [Winogradskyella sp. 3972H.M.0a.05]|uniref:lipopolysaccharide biosynthesis protein n=1 Tax=Winogradskyella sp. 3972H.M.0a.05 TaxID=2950277 RepID=UPI0033950590
MHDLKSKTVKGGFFLTITSVLNQVVAIVLNIVLARLLLAEDFGIVALSTTYIGFIAVFTNISFGSSVIHFADMNKNQISTLYWLDLMTKVFSFLIVFFTAQFVADYYEKPELTNIIRATSLFILLYPFFIVQHKILERDLKFNITSKIIVIATVLSAVVAIVGAFCGLGVYALVLQVLSLTFFRLIFTLKYCKWRPNFYFKFNEVREMFWYSLKYDLGNGFQYITRNIDYLIMGKLFSSKIIGYYAFSYNIMYTPVKRVSNVFNDILFPSLSKVKDDLQKMKIGYFKSKQLVAMIVFPVMTLVALNAELIIEFVFGSKWLEAVPIIRILCFAGAFQSITQFTSAVFASLGKPEITTYISVVRTIMTIAAIVIGSFYGILTVVWLLLISKIVDWILTHILLRLYLKFDLRDFWKYLKGILVCVLFLFMLEYVFTFSQFTELHINATLKLVFETLLAFLITMLFYKSIIIDLYKTIRKKV